VLTPAQAVVNAIALVNALVDNGTLEAGSASALISKLDGVKKALGGGNTNAASGKLGALLNELDALVLSARATEDQLRPLHALVERLIAAISP